MRIYFFDIFFHHFTNKYKSRNNSYFKKFSENAFDRFYNTVQLRFYIIFRIEPFLIYNQIYIRSKKK